MSRTSELDFTRFHNIINGELCSTEKTRHGINPATEKANPEFPVSTSHDVDAAVKAARDAFKSWQQTSYEERRQALESFAGALDSLKPKFAVLLTLETGKPIADAQAEIDACVFWMRRLSQYTLPDRIVEEDDERMVITRYRPLGVVVGIVPWNFPMHLASGKLASSVITGNTIILKPSPFASYCNLKFAELAQQFFPPGVIQGLSGDDSLGPWLTSHRGVDKISFTGSTATGKRVMETASTTLKRVTLELGGNDAAIVCADADIELASRKVCHPLESPYFTANVLQLTTLAFGNAGQVCLAPKRLYIHSSIFSEMRDRMVKHTQELNVGNGAEPGTTLGPVQNEMQYRKVKEYFSQIHTDHWDVAVGGSLSKSPGFFFNPTIIDNPKDESRIVVEEPFGPIVPILSWEKEDEVIDRVNNTKLGLGASVWSSDLTQARRLAEKIEAGSVWVNAHLEVSPAAPFGGFKESGIGSEWGEDGLKGLCNVQSLFLKKKL